jgi:hypothetical protein
VWAIALPFIIEPHVEKEDILCAIAAFGAGSIVKYMYVELLWTGAKGLIA